MLNKKVKDLLAYRRLKYLSQAGEAGILEEIFKRLKVSHGTFLEVGATDGLFLSNTYQFIKKGWQGIYIEANLDEFNKLCQNINFDNAINIHAEITPTGKNSLDQILSNLKIPRIDLMILDIDSYDLEVVENLNTFKPTILMVEFNPFLKISQKHRVSFADNPSYEGNSGKGSSFLSMHEAVITKGYSLICSLNMNAIYIDSNLIEKVACKNLSPNDVSTFEFQKLRSLNFKQLIQKIYYLGFERIFLSILIKLKLRKIYQYPLR